MAFKIRKHGTVTASFATPQEIIISHANDSIRLGDGTDLFGPLQNVGGVLSFPVKVMSFEAGHGLALDATLTGGTARTKITNGSDNVGISTVGADKALKVDVVQTVGGGAGGTSATDSAAYTAGTSTFTPTGGAFDDVASDALAEGEMGIVRLTAARAMHVDVRNASLAVTGTFWQATQPVSAASLPLPSGAATEATLASLLTSSQLLDDVIATIAAAVPTKVSFIGGSDGTNARALKTDASGELQVDVLTMPTVAVTGTFWQATQPVSGPLTDAQLRATAVPVSGTFWQATQPVSGTVTANAGSGTFATGGVAAHDAAVSGNPVRVAGRAMLANGTAVAEDDTVDMACDNQGRQITTLHVPRDLTVHATGTQATTTEATMLTAGAAGVFHDITKLILTNEHATSSARVQIRDATAGTIRLEITLAPLGGAVLDFGAVPMCQTTAANNWTIDLNAAVSTVYFYVQAIKRIA